MTIRSNDIVASPTSWPGVVRAIRSGTVFGRMAWTTPGHDGQADARRRARGPESSPQGTVQSRGEKSNFAADARRCTQMGFGAPPAATSHSVTDCMTDRMTGTGGTHAPNICVHLRVSAAKKYFANHPGDGAKIPQPPSQTAIAQAGAA